MKVTAITEHLRENREFYDSLRKTLRTKDPTLQVQLETVNNPKQLVGSRGESLSEVFENMRKLDGQGPLRASVRELHTARVTELGSLEPEDCQRSMKQGPQAVGELLIRAAQALRMGQAQKTQTVGDRFYNSLRRTLDTRDPMLQIRLEPVNNPKNLAQNYRAWGIGRDGMSQGCRQTPGCD